MTTNAFKNLFFVVEEGQANLGDFKKALAMIDVANGVGADAIEFQLAIAEDFYVREHPNFERYRAREFSDAQRAELISYAKGKNISFVAVPLSHKLVEPLAKAGCSAFNINASDLTNPDIIDAVVDSGIPFFLSLPLATEKEIEWAINRIRTKGIKASFSLLHGQHTMGSTQGGVDIASTSLGYLPILKKKYNVPVGFIDHTSLLWMPAAAIAAGADFVTKHLALSRNDKGPDWHICLEPNEMKEAIILAKKMRESIKIDFKKLASGEGIDRAIMRRSIVASRTIEAGKIVSREDFVFKRPGTGLDPSRYAEIVGKIVAHEIKKDAQINFQNLK